MTPALPIAATNSAFSSTLPGLQLAWDSTSLGLLKECPQKYQFSILYGYEPRLRSVHLSFGLWYHAALEVYDRARAAGTPHEPALALALRRALVDSWDTPRGRPWTSDDPNKNRLTLVRTVIWYLDEKRDDPLQTVVLASGRAAVELSFQFDSGYTTASGEPYILCGHIDKLVTFQGTPYILDRKTTKRTISSEWFDSFSPDNQFSLYTFASRTVLGVPAQGLIVDGAQVAVTFSRFAREIVPRPPAVLAEWYRDLEFWLAQAELYARRGVWPKNEKSCGSYGGCAFRRICSMAPSARGQWLERDFQQRVWNPTVARGDV